MEHMDEEGKKRTNARKRSVRRASRMADATGHSHLTQVTGTSPASNRNFVQLSEGRNRFTRYVLLQHLTPCTSQRAVIEGLREFKVYE